MERMITFFCDLVVGMWGVGVAKRKGVGKRKRGSSFFVDSFDEFAQFFNTVVAKREGVGFIFFVVRFR